MSPQSKTTGIARSSMTPSELIRLECLKVAVERSKSVPTVYPIEGILTMARAFEDYVLEGSASS